MMKVCRKIIIALCCILLILQSAPASAQFSSSYNYYIDLSRQAIAKNDLQSLLFYIEAAHVADPSKEEPFGMLKNVPIYQINIPLLKGYLLQAIQALERGAYRSALFYFQLSLMVTPDDTLIKEYIDYVKRLIRGEITDEKPLVERIKKEFKIEVPIEAKIEKIEKKEEPKRQEEETFEIEADVMKEPTPPSPAPRRVKKAVKKYVPNKTIVKDTVILDERLWALQPNTTIEVEFHKSVILRGQNIDRWLALQQDYIDVGRIDRNHIQITALRRGSSLLHVWDDTGRWTFNIKGVLPPIAREGLRRSREELWEEYVSPFRLAYSNNWNAFYTGNSPKNLHRQNLTFTQYIGLYGQTPYGDFDASATFFKFKETTENTARAVGLTNGKIGPFKDFTLRGFDTFKRFSDLSLPGRYFRGGLLDAYAFNRKLKYSFLRGQDRANFVTISQNVTEIRKSYIEGARLTLNPEGASKYSINYARGWGIERPTNLRDKVFSFDTQHSYGPFKIDGELAYDEEDYGRYVNTTFEQDNYKLRINARDIERNFTTITSRPSSQGEVGGNIIFDWESDSGLEFSTNLDIYKDREIPNPDDPDSLNYDVALFVNAPLSETMHLNTSAFYTDTPQLISPRRNTSVNTTLSTSFKILNDRTLSTFFGATFQRNRFSKTPQSEYDRYTVRAGFRFPIFRSLAYFLNYDYSWVDVIESGEENTPSVVNTGLSYSKTFANVVTTRASVSWRDEQNTEGRFSFLSGTDILRTNLGISYHPKPDLEIFFDGSIRNVLSERSSEAAFNDADVRFGVRTSWDLLFGWNPKGVIKGYVYKDLNKNGIREYGEPGIKGVRVQVGKHVMITSGNGYYHKEVRAEKVKVAIKVDSIPKGYNLTSDESKRVVIEQGKYVTVDFGLSVRTEVYGVIFHDKNNSGKFESNETTVPGAKIILDGEVVTRSDFEGIFTFYDIKPGAHTLRMDINSIPIEYIPKVRVKTDIVVTEGSSYNYNIPLRKK